MIIRYVKTIVCSTKFLRFLRDYHQAHNNQLDKRQHIVALHENLYTRYIFQEQCNKYRLKLAFEPHLNLLQFRLVKLLYHLILYHLSISNHQHLHKLLYLDILARKPRS